VFFGVMTRPLKIMVVGGLPLPPEECTADLSLASSFH